MPELGPPKLFRFPFPLYNIPAKRASTFPAAPRLSQGASVVDVAAPAEDAFMGMSDTHSNRLVKSTDFLRKSGIKSARCPAVTVLPWLDPGLGS